MTTYRNWCEISLKMYEMDSLNMKICTNIPEDYVIGSTRIKVEDIKVHSGAECDTDDHLLIVKVYIPFHTNRDKRPKDYRLSMTLYEYGYEV